MTVQIALPLFYSCLFLWLIAKSGHFSSEAVSPTNFSILASIKMLAGILYWYFNEHDCIELQDTGRFIADGEVVFSSLKESSSYYLQLVFGRNDYLPEPEHLCSYIDQMGFWYDQGNYTMVRINALISLISFGSKPVHFIVFSFLSFIGGYHLFRFFERETNLNEHLIIFIVFLLPGVLFWTSGAHKEAIVIFLAGIALNQLSLIIQGDGRWLRWLLLATSIILLGLVRFYTMAIFLPGLAAFYLSSRSRYEPILIFAGFYGLFIFSAITFDINSDGFRFAEEITLRQDTFLKSIGDTSFALQTVSNSWTNILKLLPQAFVNPFIRPLPGSCHNFLCHLASIESVLYSASVIVLAFRIKWKELISNRVALLCLSVGICLTLLIGLIVNNSGAIVRYRSVSMIFILMGLIISTVPVYRKAK